MRRLVPGGAAGCGLHRSIGMGNAIEHGAEYGTGSPLVAALTAITTVAGAAEMPWMLRRRNGT